MNRRTHVLTIATLAAAALVLSLGTGTALGHDDHLTPQRGSELDAEAPTVTAEMRRSAPPPPLLPNLRSVPVKDLSIEMRNGYRWLRFESAIGNTGRGPLETRPDSREECRRGERHASQVIYRDVDLNRRYKRSVDTRKRIRPAGCMVFHPRHDHWHFDAASRYSLVSAEEQQAVARHRKTSFCLRDSRRVPAPWGATKRYGSYYGYCDQNNPQGIMIGWSDVYQSFLAGQALRLPKNLPNGRYCVKVVVDPLDQLRESDDTDNSSVRAVRIRNRSVEAIHVSACR